MRFLSLFLLFILLLNPSAQASACEHSVSPAELSQVLGRYSFIKAFFQENDCDSQNYRISPKISHINFCCTSGVMNCCLSVTNTLTLIKSIHQISEKIVPESDNYKSYVAYTQQRPPCQTVA